MEAPKPVERPNVRLIGFSNVDGGGEKALLEVQGEIYSLDVGGSAEGIEVLTISPPQVTFQFSKQRWNTKLFEQPWHDGPTATAFAANGATGNRGGSGSNGGGSGFSRGSSGRSASASFSSPPRTSVTARKSAVSRATPGAFSQQAQPPLTMPGIGGAGMGDSGMPGGLPGGLPGGGAPGGIGGGAPGGIGGGAPGGIGGGAPGGIN